MLNKWNVGLIGFVLIITLTINVQVKAQSATANVSAEDLTKSYYDLLGVPKDASSKDVKKAYRVAALVNHPDKFNEPKIKALAERIFIRVVKGYETLVDPMRRRQYDKMLEYGIVDHDLEAFRKAQAEKGAQDGDAYGYYDVPDYSFSDAEQVFSEESFDEEIAGPLLGLGMIGTLALCVIPVVYGLYTMRKKKPNYGKLIRSANPKLQTADKDKQAQIEKELQEIRKNQQKYIKAQKEAEALAAQKKAEKEKREREIAEFTDGKKENKKNNCTLDKC